MKFLGLFVLFFSLSAFAENPLMRACDLTDGEFHAVELENDQFGFCIYGSAMMDSFTILDQIFHSSKTLAAEAFEDGLSCEEANGYEVVGTDLEGLNFEICRFSDGSMIESETLQAGPQSVANTGLVKALQTKIQD